VTVGILFAVSRAWARVESEQANWWWIGPAITFVWGLLYVQILYWWVATWRVLRVGARASATRTVAGAVLTPIGWACLAVLVPAVVHAVISFLVLVAVNLWRG
jgi:hypothetical protein